MKLPPYGFMQSWQPYIQKIDLGCPWIKGQMTV